MKHHIPLLAAAALLSLSACSKSEPEVVGGPADPMAEQVANAGPIELPPAVKASKQYRCKDNSLIFVDFLSDDKTANLRLEKNGAPTKLVAAEAGGALKAEGGYEVSGSGSPVTIAVPGKSAQSCKA
jgi:predicted small lipoprotein YifL